LRNETERPHIHDMRHAFAVRVLVSWYRSGVDAAGRMALLSTYLGHVNPVDTYWYLSISPELIEVVTAHIESRPDGGER
jgi:integrase/recombinase XerD